MGWLSRRGTNSRAQPDDHRRRAPKRSAGRGEHLLPAQRFWRADPVGARSGAAVRGKLSGCRQADRSGAVLRLRWLVHQPGDRWRRSRAGHPGAPVHRVHQGLFEPADVLVRRDDNHRSDLVPKRLDQQQRSLLRQRRRGLRWDVPQLQLERGWTVEFPVVRADPRAKPVCPLCWGQRSVQWVQFKRPVGQGLPRRPAARRIDRILSTRLGFHVIVRSG